MLAGDDETLRRLRHPDWTDTWLQSGEVVRGHENWMAINRGYPGGLPRWEMSTISGVEETRVVATPGLGPLGGPITITGGGDTFTLEGRLRYPDGGVFCVVVVGRVAEGKVVEQRTYFAEPFDPPEWRRRWVEVEPG